MALTKTNDDKKIQVKSIISDDSVEEHGMDIDFNAMPHIINRLTDLYGDPLVATIREIISNAMDSISAIKNPNTSIVEVTTPNATTSSLVIKDNGVGMDKNELINVFSKYGSSLKKSDFNQIGAYGLGAKAPLAYCREFTVISIKNHMRTEILLTRKPEGNFVKVISESRTVNESGTTVIIPIPMKDHGRVKEILNNYRYITSEVPLYINGEMVKDSDEFIYFDDFLLDSESDVVGKVWINRNCNTYLNQVFSNSTSSLNVSFVLSGWIYSMENRVEDSTFIVELKPGVVNFSSSRDEITTDDRYYQLIQEFNQNYKNLDKNLRDCIIKLYFSGDQNLKQNIALSMKNFMDKESYTQNSFIIHNIEFLVSDFEVKGEINYLKAIINGYEKNVYFAINFLNAGNYSETNFDGKTLNFTNKLVVSRWIKGKPITDVNDDLIKKIKSNNSKRDSLENIIFNAVLSNNSYYSIKKSDVSNLIVISDSDLEIVEKITKNRKLLSETIFNDSLVILASDITTFNKKHAQQLTSTIDSVTIKYMTKESLIKNIEIERSKIRKNRTSKVSKNNIINIKVLENPIIEKEPESISYDTKTYSATLDEIINEDSIIILSYHYNDYQRILKGIVNSENVDFVNKNIYIIDRSDLVASDYVKLKEYNKVFMSSLYSYHSKSFDDFAKASNRVYEDKHLLGEIKKVDDSVLIRTYLYSRFPNISNYSDWMQFIHSNTSNSRLMAIFDLLQKSSLVRPRNDLFEYSEEFMKEKYGEELLHDLQKFSYLIASYSKYSSLSDLALYGTALNLYDPKQNNEVVQMVLNYVKKEIESKLS